VSIWLEYFDSFNRKSKCVLFFYFFLKIETIVVVVVDKKFTEKVFLLPFAFRGKGKKQQQQKFQSFFLSIQSFSSNEKKLPQSYLKY
jgi:hypothetical protein